MLTQKGYGSAIDMWAIGVITYTLLCGYQPFQAEDQVELVDEITNARYDFHERYWRNISIEGKKKKERTCKQTRLKFIQKKSQGFHSRSFNFR